MATLPLASGVPTTSRLCVDSPRSAISRSCERLCMTVTIPPDQRLMYSSMPMTILSRMPLNRLMASMTYLMTGSLSAMSRRNWPGLSPSSSTRSSAVLTSGGSASSRLNCVVTS